MKTEQHMVDCRRAIFLSFVIATGRWQGASSIILPQQWQPGHGSDVINVVEDAPPMKAVSLKSINENSMKAASINQSSNLMKPVSRSPRRLRKSPLRNSSKVSIVLRLPETTNTSKVQQPLNDGPALIQKRAARSFRKGHKKTTAGRGRGGSQPVFHRPRVAIERHMTDIHSKIASLVSVEDGLDLIYGIPKIVWVILADAVGIGAWIGCIAGVLYLSKLSSKPSGPTEDDLPLSGKQMNWDRLEFAMPSSAQWRENSGNHAAADSAYANRTPTFMGPGGLPPHAYG